MSHRRKFGLGDSASSNLTEHAVLPQHVRDRSVGLCGGLLIGQNAQSPRAGGGKAEYEAGPRCNRPVKVDGSSSEQVHGKVWELSMAELRDEALNVHARVEVAREEGRLGANRREAAAQLSLLSLFSFFPFQTVRTARYHKQTENKWN